MAGHSRRLRMQIQMVLYKSEMKKGDGFLVSLTIVIVMENIKTLIITHLPLANSFILGR